jgi:hypothetical protein
MRGSSVEDGGRAGKRSEGGGVDVEEVEREQGSGEGNVPKSHDSDNYPHPSQKGEGAGRAMDAICRGPRRLDSSGTSTVTDISTVLKVSQDSVRP